MAATHFQPYYARQAFPCFDEPIYKSTFKIIINHDNKYFALSNMPIESKIHLNQNIIQTVFQITPAIPTYSVSIVVSDFANITNKYRNNTIFARSDILQHLDYALEQTEILLKELENYTGINYSLPYIQQAVVPDEKSATENLGLILYRSV